MRNDREEPVCGLILIHMHNPFYSHFIREFAVESVLYLLNNWPEGYGANTPKEVLFIHEMEKLLHYIDQEEFSEVRQRVWAFYHLFISR